jgi:predicted acyltransferase
MTNQNSEINQTSKRLLSLDALRGFDMFWIIGGDRLIHSLAKATDWGWVDGLNTQVTHAKWHGFLAYDLIFPLFMFLAGVSIPFAILSKLEKGVPRRNLVWKIIRRAVVLIILGIIYNGGLRNFENPRYASVLGQIGVGYGIAAIVCLFSKNIKTVLLSFLFVCLTVTVAQLCIPVPGHGANILTQDGCMNAYLDQLFLPGKFYSKHYDPQGILCMVSGVGTTLIGVLTGFLLRKESLNGYRKTGLMAGAGMALISVALLANPWYPINKEIWTTPFTLLSGGISLLLLAIFYLLIDVLHFTRWSFPLRVIGMNAIMIYMGSSLFNLKQTSQFLFSGIASLYGNFESVIGIIGLILVEWLLLYFFYKKKIFLKV